MGFRVIVYPWLKVETFASMAASHGYSHKNKESYAYMIGIAFKQQSNELVFSNGFQGKTENSINETL